MVRILLAALALATLAVVPPAAADAGSQYFGGCGASFEEDPERPGVMVGAISAQVVLYSVGFGNPVSAVVTCGVKVDGVVVDEASFAGTVVVAGAEYMEYVDSWNVDICETVDFTSDDTPTQSFCAHGDPTQIPPQEVYNAVCPFVGWDACEELRKIFS